MNSLEVFIHIHQCCFAGTGAILRLPQCQWSKPDGYGKISQCITTTKHSKAKSVCIFLWIYCIELQTSRHTSKGRTHYIYTYLYIFIFIYVCMYIYMHARRFPNPTHSPISHVACSFSLPSKLLIPRRRFVADLCINVNEIITVTIITADPLQSRALAHSRAPLFKQPCPHCSHSRARENNEHGCVYLRSRAVCKLPGSVEGHPEIMKKEQNFENHSQQPMTLIPLWTHIFMTNANSLASITLLTVVVLLYYLWVVHKKLWYYFVRIN